MEPTQLTDASASFQPRIDLLALRQSISDIRSEIGKIIVGQHEFIDLLLVGLLADGHVLIEGVPGVAKTLTARLLAQTASVQFSRIQFTPDLMPSDVTGTSVYNQKTSEFEFKKGPIFSNIVLIDEINRAPAKTQAALFECMQEKQVTADGITHTLQPPFMVLATQNPIEQEGTYRLPEAQLDRFIFKIVVNYPSDQEEVTLIKNFHQAKGAFQSSLGTPVISATQIEQYRKLVHLVNAEEKLLEYIAKIVLQTRNNPFLFLGASPRATLSILTGAKAHAAIQGRDFITPEDVKFIAPHVLRHRIVLTPEKEMEGFTEIQAVNQVIDAVEVPR